MSRNAIASLLLRLSPPRWRESIAGDFEEAAGGAVSTLWHGTRLIARLWLEELAIARADTRRRSVMTTFARSLRLAARSLVTRPAYSLIVIATLAIGIGAGASVFTLANWLMLRPLPAVHDAGSLVTMRFAIGNGVVTISHVEKNTVAENVPALVSLAGSMEASFNIAADGVPAERVEGAIVSADYFDVLGVRPAAGVAFSPSNPGIVVSHRYWQTRLGGHPGTVGGTIIVNGHRERLLGVAPSGFSGLSRSSAVDVWVPSTRKAALFPGAADRDLLADVRAGIYIELIGRLRPGASIADVEQALPLAKANVSALHTNPKRYEQIQFTADAGPSAPRYERERLQNLFALLVAMVGLLLVLTCANVGNVVLASGTGRRAEIATRQALGATRGQVVGTVILECVLLSLAGGAAALAIAAAIGRLMRGTIVIPYLAPLGDVGLDARVFAFAFGVSTLAALGAGVLPALAATRFDLLSALKTSARSVTGGGRRLRRALLVAQVALSLTLLVGALLLTQSVRERRRIDPGFDTQPLMSFSVEPGLHSRGDGALAAFYADLLERVSAVPGVERAALGWNRPFGFMANQGDMRAVAGLSDEAVETEIYTVGEHYFETMGIPIVAGRAFTASDPGEDYKSAEGNVVVSASVATRLFGSPAAAVGGTLIPEFPENARRRIVGVAADARLRRAFVPSVDAIYARLRRDAPWATVHVRLREGADAAAVAPRLRQALRQADATLPAYDVMTVRAAIERQMTEEVLVGRLTLAFALIATFLAAVGLYGVLAQSVTERRVEIGIRGALGAAPARVLRMVTWDALRTTMAGAAAGVLLSLWLGRYIESRLFGVDRFDGAAFAAALAAVIVMSLAAAAIPALRAARVDPVTALRQ